LKESAAHRNLDVVAARRYRWLIFFILAAIYFLACVHRVAPTVIARDLAGAFDAEAFVLGLIASSYFYLYSAVQPAVGMLADTVGPRRVVAVFTLVASVGGLLFGAAPNALLCGLGRALIGAGVGGVFIPTLKIFSRWFRASEFAGLTGMLLAVSGLGGLAAALPLTYLVLLLGWRNAFVLLGAISLLLAVAAWAVVRDRPQDKGWPALESEGLSSRAVSAAASQEMKTLARLGLVFRNADFWRITLSMFFSGGVSLTFQGLWAVPYTVDVYGLSRPSAGGLLMVMPLSFSVGAPLLGFLVDQKAWSRKKVLVFSMACTMAGWVVLLFFGGRFPYLLLVPLFLVFGLGGGGSLTLYMTIVKELFPPAITGTAMGFMNPAAFLAAAFFQPLTGFLLDRVGRLASGAYPLEAYRLVFGSFLACILVSLILTCTLSLSRAKDDGGPAAHSAPR